jgi:hypothetical protein
MTDTGGASNPDVSLNATIANAVAVESWYAA